MYEKTQAIVLRLRKHTDKASILTLYTRELGQVTCLVHGLHGKKSNNKKALFEPLNLLEVELQHKNNSYRIAESRIVAPFTQIPYDMGKRSIAMLLAEVLTYALRDPVENVELFDFLRESIAELDACEQAANFPVMLLIQLTTHLGVQPNIENEGNYFDIETGTSTQHLPQHPHYLAGREAQLFRQIVRSTYADMAQIHSTRQERRALLNSIINYYLLHVPEFRIPKSMDILSEVLESMVE